MFTQNKNHEELYFHNHDFSKLGKTQFVLNIMGSITKLQQTWHFDINKDLPGPTYKALLNMEAKYMILDLLLYQLCKD